jgi:hypothetical protein
VIVIGAGSAFNGPVELVAYRTTQCLVIETDLVRLGDATESCAYPLAADRVLAIDLSGYSGLNRTDRWYSDYSGPVRTDAAAIRATFKKKKGHTQQGGTVLAKPTADILTRLGVSQPFAYWAAVFHGCAAGRGLRIRALDASGELLGYRRAGFASCAHHRPPGK